MDKDAKIRHLKEVPSVLEVGDVLVPPWCFGSGGGKGVALGDPHRIDAKRTAIVGRGEGFGGGDPRTTLYHVRITSGTNFFNVLERF